MGRTRTNIRQTVARQFGLPFVDSASTASTATTITDVPGLSRFDDDQLIGIHVYINDATVPNRVITDSVQSTGVITFRPSSSAGMDGTDDYELMPYAGDAIHSAIDQALRMLYHEGIMTRKFWLRGVSGSPIYNGFPEYWTSSTVLDGWTATGLTLARSLTAANKYVIDYAAAFSAGTGSLRLDPVWARFLQDFTPNAITIRAWLRSDTASALRFGWVNDAGTVTASAYHSGDGEWELRSLESTSLILGDTQWTLRIIYDDAATTDEFGGIWVEGGAYPALHPFPIALAPKGPLNIYSYPTAVDVTNLKAAVNPSVLRPERSWGFMRYHDEAADVDVGVVKWGLSRPTAGRLLLMECEGPLTIPTADTGVIEINQYEELIVAKAAALILMDASPISGNAAWQQRRDRLARDLADLVDNMAVGAVLGPNW